MVPAVVGFGLFVLAWELVAAHDRYVVPSVPAIYRQLVDNRGMYLSSLLVTLEQMAVGLGFSFAVAFSLAVAMSQLRPIERAVMPLAVVINVTPIVAITPALAFAFGFSVLPKYIVTALVVFYPLLVNCLAGLRSIESEALEVFESVHASRFEILWRLRLPSSLPWIFAGLRIALPLSVVGAIVAEFLVSGSSEGLGSLIEIGQGDGSLVQIYAPTALLAALGVVLLLAVSACERVLLASRIPLETAR